MSKITKLDKQKIPSKTDLPHSNLFQTQYHPKIADALDLHQNGQIYIAEQLYKKILQVEPKNSEIFHLLGSIAHQRGQHQYAIELIRSAIKLNPAVVAYYLNLGNLLQELHQFADAVDEYEKAINLCPRLADCHYLKGVALQSLK